jgi:hypothetical protein
MSILSGANTVPQLRPAAWSRLRHLGRRHRGGTARHSARGGLTTFQQAKADHDYNEQELELKTNTELTREIDRLTIELHKRVVGTTAAVGGEGPAQAAPSQAGDG